LFVNVPIVQFVNTDGHAGVAFLSETQNVTRKISNTVLQERKDMGVF